MVPSATGAATDSILVPVSQSFALSPAASVGGIANTNNLIVLNPNGSASPMDTAANTAYTPAQIRQAYGFNQITFDNGTIQGNGSGQTIAIVDAYSDPNIANDLHQFDIAFGLPDPSLNIAQEYVNGQPPPVDPTGKWEGEESLDVEWAHAMAPAANILFIEANPASLADMYSAVQWAANQPGVSVVSMSWGSSNPGESANDSYFTTPQGHAGVTFVAASGDHGGFGYPASSPNVLAVGGTTLSVDASGNYLGETVWNYGNGWSGGGGQDPNYPNKQGPDVAYNAGAPVWIYDSFGNSQNPWQGVIGTSAGSPQWAALIAIADQGRALEGQGPLDGPSQTLPMLHNMPSSAFHTDIPGSNQYGVSGQGAIGLGSPYADLVVAGLSGQPAPIPPVPSPPPTPAPPFAPPQSPPSAPAPQPVPPETPQQEMFQMFLEVVQAELDELSHLLAMLSAGRL